MRILTFLISYVSWVLARIITKSSQCVQKCNRNSGHKICIRFCRNCFWAVYYIVIYTHPQELMKSVGIYGSSSLLFVIMVMVWHFVSNTQKVMIALIVVLLATCCGESLWCQIDIFAEVSCWKLTECVVHELPLVGTHWYIVIHLMQLCFYMSRDNVHHFDFKHGLPYGLQMSATSLFMPEPEDAVPHGDANLALNDFFGRS